jgi:glycosyltransferase involved in cell wall biosynthesis
MARTLGEHNDLTFIFFQEPGLQAPSRKDFPFCREIIAVPGPRLYSRGRLLRGLVGRWPLPVVNYTSELMKRALSKVVKGARFDLVHMDGIHLVGYQALLQRESAGTQIFYNWHNVESELMRRYSQQAPSLPRKFYAAFTAPRLATVEKYLLKSASGHVVCSEREREHLLGIVPSARIRVIENGVDRKYFSESQPEPRSRNRVVFVGAMAYHANIDAAGYFAREVWPLIYARFPEWRLTLVGSNPTPAVTVLRECPGVEVTGTIPDVRPYYGDAVAAIVPLRSGSGTRLKILEAMAAGVPVISTTIGAEGLDVSPGRNILIADRETEWVPALESIAAPGALRSELIREGRQFVDTKYDWDALGAMLRETYHDWLKR